MKKNPPLSLGVIPDGNRRWAENGGLGLDEGYSFGIQPGLRLYRACRRAGVERIALFGFSQEHAKRPAAQVRAFRAACVELARRLAEEEGAAIRAVGDRSSKAFPRELEAYEGAGGGDGPSVDLLVNYGWEWDLAGERGRRRTEFIPPLDAVIRWGGGRSLGGFLPAQCANAEIFVVDAPWPEFRESHLDAALSGRLAASR